VAYIRFVSLKHSVCGKEINLFQELSTRMSQLSQSRQSLCVRNGGLAANLDSNNSKIVILIFIFRLGGIDKQKVKQNGQDKQLRTELRIENHFILLTSQILINKLSSSVEVSPEP